ncbi:MAG: MATE family efflux transporter [Myxococcota bacterium]|jgi:MATE family multidrug resistance protein|nr:MATE family efflux transporter [Myxococcota bacterium]
MSHSNEIHDTHAASSASHASSSATSSIPPERRGGLAEVIELAIPVVLTNLSITAMQIVDSVMVGQLGAPQLASVGFGGVWLWTIMCFFVGTTTCVQTFVSQAYGSGQHRGCGSWAWQGIYAVVPIALVIATALFLGAEALVAALDPDPTLAPFAVDYIVARAYGTPGIIAAVALASFFRGLGDTRTPLYASVASNLLNAVLDYGLIFGRLGLPQLGVEGAGIATSIAEWANFVLLFWFFRKPHIVREFGTRIARPAREPIRRLMRTGLPVGGQWWLEMASFALFLTLVARMGDAPMAASQAFISLLSISFMQAQGIAIAVSTMVGQYIGAKDLAAAERSFGSGLRLCLLLAGVVGAVLIAFPDQLIGIYSDDVRVIELGRPLLFVGALFQIFDALAILADGGLRGAGDTRWPMIARFLFAWFVFLPTAWLFGVYFEGGLTWAWVGGLVYIACLTLILLQRFRGGTWKTIEI